MRVKGRWKVTTLETIETYYYQYKKPTLFVKHKNKNKKTCRKIKLVWLPSNHKG